VGSLLWLVTALTYLVASAWSGGTCALVIGIFDETEVVENQRSVHGDAAGVSRSGAPEPSGFGARIRSDQKLPVNR